MPLQNLNNFTRNTALWLDTTQFGNIFHRVFFWGKIFHENFQDNKREFMCIKSDFNDWLNEQVESIMYCMC